MTGRWLQIGLGVSLTANLFLVGAIAGALYMQSQKPPPRGPMPLGRACAGAATATRGPFWRMYCNQVLSTQPIREDSFETKQQAMTLMIAPTYDRAAIGALFDRARADDMKARAQVENAILDFAGPLPVDKRQRLVEAMRGNARRRMMMRRGMAAGD